MKRLHNLDYLRGLAAFGIMIYHFLSWSHGKYSAETFMGRLGLYGVSIFYILSGLTLYYVYINKMKPNGSDLLSFFKKRVFRIFPLLWLVTIVSLVLARKMPNFTDVFLNLSGLFGFIKWDTYFSPGVWSIGNELVFYVFFPFFILFLKRFKPLMIFLSLAIFGLYLFFAFYRLDPNLKLSEQWSIYINPLNQVFLFLSGFLMGYFFQNIKVKNSICLILFTLGLGLFIFYPVTGDTIHLVSGFNRLVFTIISILICFSFYKLSFKFNNYIHKPLTLLGESSYSVYLLHPLVWGITGYATRGFNTYVFKLPQETRFILSVIFSLIISYFVYQYFEKYFMKLGKSKKKPTI